MGVAIARSRKKVRCPSRAEIRAIDNAAPDRRDRTGHQGTAAQ
jgi:hypothetical protein